MKRKEYETKRATLFAQAEALESKGDVEGMKNIVTQIEALDAEYDASAQAQANLAALKAQHIETGIVVPSAMETGAAIAGAAEGDIFASTEYRVAFANYIAKGKAIPAKFYNANENTTTGDVAAVIPTTIIPRIVEKMESIGMILPLVSRTAYATGVSVPTSTVKPVATWVTEGASSDRQKKITGSITFTKFKLRCEISWTMEVNEMSLGIFETTFINQVSEAMIKKLEGTIISAADGTTSPKGILSETPATGQALSVAELSYQTLIDAEAALPEAYEGGAVWVMSKKTFMAFVGLVDDAGQPIARVNYGIGGRPERTLLGRPVVTCGDYLPSFATTLTDGTIFAMIFRFSDYVLNTVYDMGIQRKQDWDTEDMLTKAVMSCDGKVVDKNSLVTLAFDTEGQYGAV